jgi:predicted site-specific integrase-resolvase
VFLHQIKKKDWEVHLGRLVGYAQNHRLVVVQAVVEVGSGWNGHRHRLIQLWADPQVEAIVVEHRDRLMRIGAEYGLAADSSARSVAFRGESTPAPRCIQTPYAT